MAVPVPSFVIFSQIEEGMLVACSNIGQSPSRYEKESGAISVVLLEPKDWVEEIKDMRMIKVFNETREV